VDLFRAGMGQNPAIPLSHARQPVTGAIRYLQAQRPARFVGIVPTQLLTPMPADAAMRYGLYDARSYDYPIEARYDRVWRRYVAPQVPFIPPTTLASTTPVALRVLGLLGVRSLMQQPIDPPLHTLRRVYAGSDARIYANPSVLPRAFLVDRQDAVHDDRAALAAIGDPDVPLARVAVTERPLAGLAGSAAGSPGTARLTAYQPQRVTISATAADRSLLVLSDLSYPGWGATVDGHPVALQRVDYLLRGVPLAPGRHRVEMAYAPAPWRAGWLVSVVSALALAVTAAAGARRRTRSPAR
jgi:Bacterial membrane protein YfhO